VSDLRRFKDGVPEDFNTPASTPKDQEQASSWQESNRAWWERNPMRYDFGDAPVSATEGTREFYEEIDRRFFRTAFESCPWAAVPFDTFIPFNDIRDKRVLEVGVGCGSHAQLLAPRSGRYVGIDLTSYATETTAARLALFGLPGGVIRMDAEHLGLATATFDFVWSWGVIHHSSNTRAALEEIYRVMRPGGTLVVMVYHRSFWNTVVRGGLYYGILRGGFLRGASVHRLLQETTDGAIARYYSVGEWRALVSDLFDVVELRVLGHKTQLLPLPSGRLKTWLGSWIPGGIGRFVTNRPLMGYLLVTVLQKR